jgi:hypothetical protein
VKSKGIFREEMALRPGSFDGGPTAQHYLWEGRTDGLLNWLSDFGI